MYGKYRFLTPWILGALVWLFVGLTILLEYRKTQPAGQGYLTELWFLVSLLWLQFGFAGIFQAVRGGRGFKILAHFLVALTPPLLLYLLIFVLLSP